jgi:endogenous inhibitor of DNA gyrase (YacG/DUF329 family)
MTRDVENPDLRPKRVCPICGQPASGEAFPFCSKRCADIDLNRWLKGVYAIPTAERPRDGEATDDE